MFGTSGFDIFTRTHDDSQVVHVVETSGTKGEYKEPTSYISFFSTTPGKLTKEIEQIGEGFVCGRENVVDFVTFTTKYSCWTKDDSVNGWTKSDIPTLNVESESRTDERLTQVTVDTKVSTRWTLAINTNKIDDFRLKGSIFTVNDFFAPSIYTLVI